MLLPFRSGKGYALAAASLAAAIAVTSSFTTNGECEKVLWCLFDCVFVKSQPV